MFFLLFGKVDFGFENIQAKQTHRRHEIPFSLLHLRCYTFCLMCPFLDSWCRVFVTSKMNYEVSEKQIFVNGFEIK